MIHTDKMQVVLSNEEGLLFLRMIIGATIQQYQHMVINAIMSELFVDDLGVMSLLTFPILFPQKPSIVRTAGFSIIGTESYGDISVGARKFRPCSGVRNYICFGPPIRPETYKLNFA